MTGTKIIHLRGEGSTRRVWLDDVELHPQLSQKLYNHSPDGFNWGYGGSGPAQLALAVLLHISNEMNALANYQRFKFDVIAGLDQDFDINIDVSKYIRSCRVCGCTDDKACLGDDGNPCYWIEDNLCSACQGKG
jgi:hypothetical protein